MKKILLSLSVALLALGCGVGNGSHPSEAGVHVTSGLTWQVSTDKAIYAPGEAVRFTASGEDPEGLRVRYRSGSEVLSDEALASCEWSWTAPRTDGRGYLVELYRPMGDTARHIVATIGVDVSSDWTLFPRYGFVGTYDETKTPERIAEEMAYLNRCHINGIQFYDWHWKHHYPCPVENGQLLESYTDIANRKILTDVVRRYIDVQHAYGMKCFFYNLCFGSLTDGPADGVQEGWYLYKDSLCERKEFLDLMDSWKSDIYLLDPGNPDWHKYIVERNEEVYEHFDFDGFHIDQLGDWGPHFDATGRQVDFAAGFSSFIRDMKAARPDKRLVMNAVSSHCSEAIVRTGMTDAAYNECWAEEDQYASLRDVIEANRRYSDDKRQTILAAYMDYLADNCQFRTPGVLLTDAVIFSLGGSHLELGDHMLCREYFPYTGVLMSDDLKDCMVHYYDFLVAYENLLRGPGEEVVLPVESASIGIEAWPPQQGKVCAFARRQDSRHILHLINFLTANSTSWRDMEGTMPEPEILRDLELTVEVPGRVGRVYVATPDHHGGALVELPFTMDEGKVTFTVPELCYWDMILFE